MLIDCIIETPQFEGCENKYHLLRQAGVFDTDTLMFTPYFEGHKVQFRNQELFNKFRVHVHSNESITANRALFLATIAIIISLFAIIIAFACLSHSHR